MTLVQEAAAFELLERMFERKRSNFFDDYALRDVPSLVWQMAPDAKRSVDLSSPGVAQAIRAGSTTTTSEGWWHRFSGLQHPALVFEGLASHRKDHLAGYVTEFHSDGHFFAAVWTFPERDDRLSGVAPFYAAAFADALDVGLRVFQSAGVEGSVHTTCTLSGANHLPLIGQRGTLAAAPLRNVLRWPFHAVDANSRDAVQRSMATQFMRIYGMAWRAD